MRSANPVYRWIRQDRIDRGELAGTSTSDDAELRAARQRIAELEVELAIIKRASVLFDEGRLCAIRWTDYWGPVTGVSYKWLRV